MINYADALDELNLAAKKGYRGPKKVQGVLKLLKGKARQAPLNCTEVPLRWMIPLSSTRSIN